MNKIQELISEPTDHDILVEENILLPLYMLCSNLDYLIRKLEYLGDNKHYKDQILNLNFISDRLHGIGIVGFFNGEELRDSKDFIDNYLDSFIPSVSDQPSAVCEGERGGKSPLAATPKG